MPILYCDGGHSPPYGGRLSRVESWSSLADAAPDSLGSMVVGLAAGCVLLARGDGEGAIALLDPLLGTLVPMGVVQPTGWYLPSLGLAQVATDDLEAAETTIDSLDQLNSVLVSRSLYGYARLLRALVERSRGRADLAEEPGREGLSALLDVAPGPLATLALEVLAGVLGELGNYAEATRLLAAAASARTHGFWRGRPAPWCDDLVARDLAAAREALGDRFVSHWDEGASLGLAAAAEHASRARGTRSRPAYGWASLTPTELAVVELVAGGGSNPEIAARLVMSRGTVKTHVSHILTKLGLRSRAEVAAEATRRAV